MMILGKISACLILLVLIISSVSFIFILQMMAESTLTKHEAFADGLQAENIPPIAIEGHKLGLFVQLLPTYIVEGTRPHISLTVRLFESEVNENIPNVKYAITIGRFDLAAKEGIRPLVSDMFYSEPGPLILNISSIIEGVHVDAPKTYNSEAWIVDLETGAIDYGTSAVFEGGLYYIGVKIAGIGGPDQTFGENAPLFEAGLSIGYASNNDVRYQDESHSIGIISYYDKIRDFSFEESTLTFSWSMPFDWDVRRIENKDMIVHQEIKIPRTLYDISNSFSFEGTVNGIELPKNSIALDPFSFEDYMTIHYIITKQQILAISKSLHTGTSEMHLTLSAGDKNILEHPEEGKTLLLTDNGGILITIDWMPKHLEASVESKMQIRFFDTYSEQPLDKDILYDLSVLDLRGDQVISRIELIAKNGTDVQPVTFQNNDAYHVEINVKGFLLTEQNGTQQSTTLDVSRSGIARSIVNVPEFLSPLLLMASSALLVLILTSRILSRNKINGACNRSL